MEENIDIKQTLLDTNQELLLNKKKIDLDKALESLQLFYISYTPGIATEIKKTVCSYRNIDSQSEQAMVFYRTITSFFMMASKQIKEIVDREKEPLKNKISEMSDDEYNKELGRLSLLILNKTKDYFFENASMLISELDQNVDDDTKSKIDKYVLEMLTVKVINIIKDKLMFYLKVISNNNEENKEMIDNINNNTVSKL
jgi:hypothetical protein